jgi:hypothetical protein
MRALPTWDRISIKLIRNGFSALAILYVVIQYAWTNSTSSTTATAVNTNNIISNDGSPRMMSQQDMVFVSRCKISCEKQQIRRSRCDDDPLVLCQNICQSLQSDLSYYTMLWGTPQLLDACDASCSNLAVDFCQRQLPYQSFCSDIAWQRSARAMISVAQASKASSNGNTSVTISMPSTGPSFLSLLLLIFVAASDILVSIAEYKAKYLKAADYNSADGDVSQLYDANSLDSTAALLKKLLQAAESPQHLFVVAKTAFEVRSLLFDNSCVQALELILVFQVATALWESRCQTPLLLVPLPAHGQTSPVQEDDCGSDDAEEVILPTSSSSSSINNKRASSSDQIQSKSQSMNAFTQAAPTMEEAAPVTPVVPAVVAQAPATPTGRPFSKTFARFSIPLGK